MLTDAAPTPPARHGSASALDAPRPATADPELAARYRRSHELRGRAHRLVPGGAHTYAKGNDQYPELSPGFIVRGRGCHVWDVDGNEFVEYAMGLRSVTLGHAFPEVVEAVVAQAALGTNFNRPSPIEIDCAESLLDLVPGADMAKFTKDGSTATTAAMRLARAYTGRDMIALCADHPFFSYDDWAMAVTPVDAGIPPEVAALTATFRYDDLESVRELFDRHPGRIAAVILEPAKYADPAEGFLEGLSDISHRNGALVVFDESISGFRFHIGGAQTLYGVTPDLSVFGKAMANGFALAALVGMREVMRLGGIDHHDRERVFLLSTTHGAETTALAAALATMQVYRERDVIGHLYATGDVLRAGIGEAIARHGVEEQVEVIGKSCCLVFATRDPEGRPSQAYRTLLLQELLRHGVLAPSLIVSYSHQADDVRHTVAAFDAALAVYRRALEEGSDRYLVGSPSKSVYRARN